MGKIVIVATCALIVSMTVLGGPVGAAQHDRDCQFPASPNSDAADTWDAAAPLVDWNCTGEFLVNGDSADWYRIQLPLPVGNVRVCPTTIKTAPWNLDVALYARTNAAPNGPGIPTLPPGAIVGASENLVGCDNVALPPQFNQAGAQVYIHLRRTTGDGLYNLVVS